MTPCILAAFVWMFSYRQAGVTEAADVTRAFVCARLS